MMASPLPDYVLADVRRLVQVLGHLDAGTADEPELAEVLDDLMAGMCEWHAVRVEPVCCTVNRGLSARDLTVLRGLMWPLFENLNNQRGGDEAEIEMRVARVRKIRHLIYPPSAELHAVSGAVRNEDTEALRRKLRASEYPEPVRPRL